MKTIKSLLLIGIGVLTFASCNNWLDVNVDPENPSSASATYQNRLGHIEFYTNSATQFAAWRSSMSMGDWTRYFKGGTYFSMSTWIPNSGPSTTPYQWWFTGAACNLDDMYEKAKKAGAWEYAGVAKIIRAYGYMLMTDLYGEMPYKEAVGEKAIPAYDTGKTIYLGCLKDLDDGIAMLQKGQEPTLPSLAVGDFWNKGDVNKWIKLGYLLKARYINKLNKKGEGKYTDGKYDSAEILACLEKAQQSNADNTIINHTDANGPTHDVLGWNEPVDYSPIFSVCGGNAGYMVTEMLYNNLTNFAGSGVEDPRADKIIPWAISKKSENTPKNIKYVGEWRRSLGVDLTSPNSPNLSGGPLATQFDPKQGGWYIKSDNKLRLGDTVYVECTSRSKGYHKNVDLFFRKLAGNDNSRESGSFYSRVSAPTYVGTYFEACFIKAEVLFNKGDKAGAFKAYKEGIKASIEQMNEKLKDWCTEDASLASCPSFTPMKQEDIDNFLNNAIGNESNLSLGKIMTQKRIALLYSVEIWNDMRRYDFNPEIFFGWGIPAYHSVDPNGLKVIPAGKQLRRWRQCSHETKYNSENLKAIGEQVPGADNSLDLWNLADDVFTINVWWDSDQQ